MSEKFGEKLRKVRTDQKRTLEELAAAIGSSKAYVWQLENKSNAKPSAELLLKIAKFLRTSPEFFLDDEVDEPLVDHRSDALFRKFQKLSDDDKRYIERIVTGLDAADDN
ncbi:MAG: transcriptional regulator [Rhodobacteraceae bacterium]|nr:transcriptional regulator [Paracoccaceae bacterium]|tara:strand:- start:1540 stop:1869 length:330 start_codon:yes stop_codon:yes gene_type:complete